MEMSSLLVYLTGVLTFKVAPNYEDPEDVAVSDPSNAADNNEYIVYVEVTGGEKCTSTDGKGCAYYYSDRCD